MKFIKNQFPNLDADVSDYIKLKEPSLNQLALISIPVGIIAATMVFFAAQLFTSVKLSLNVLFILKGFEHIVFSVLCFIVFNVLIIIIHEFLHAIIFPERLSSDIGNKAVKSTHQIKPSITKRRN